MTTPRIALRDLHKAFGSKKVLDGITLDVMPGESMVIIGGSGTGKSVTIKCILGLIQPDSGQILIDGHNESGKRDHEAFLARFGMLFQGGRTWPSG